LGESLTLGVLTVQEAQITYYYFRGKIMNHVLLYLTTLWRFLLHANERFFLKASGQGDLMKNSKKSF
jgi:hypothetical protein